MSNLGQTKYLVEKKGDYALFEDKGQVGPGVVTNSFHCSLFWLKREGCIDLKQRKMVH